MELFFVLESGIYQIVNTINGKKYVGSSKNLEKRRSQHFNQLKRGCHHNTHLQRSYDKHGADSFVFDILEYVHYKFLKEVEQNYIDQGEYDFNIGKQSSGGDNLTNNPNREDIIERMTCSIKTRFANMSDEERAIKHSRPGSSNPNWREGRSQTPCPKCGKLIGAYQDSLSCGDCRDRTGENNPFYGKTHSAETKDRLREVATGRKQSQDAKDAVTGENNGRFAGYYHTPWGIFPSTSQAQKACADIMLSAAIQRICTNPDMEIQKTALSRSKYLSQKHDETVIGKTYRDLGFWFEPKQP